MKPSVALIPLSAIYGVITRTRLAAYRRGWFSVSRLAAPVISVGNLTTGGTGKTPMVEKVCRVLATEEATARARKRKRVCVLTRGYGRSNPNTQVVVSNGAELLAGEEESGDEPFLLAGNLLGTAAVIANPNRVAAGEWAIKNLQTDCFVLDDGFQHLPLARNLDLVIIDATNPWGGGLLPYGSLREPPSGLSRADCIVITRADQVTNLSTIREAVERSVGAVPIFSSRMVTTEIRTLDGKHIDIETLRAQRPGAFCGVGNPKSFFDHLSREGLAPTFSRKFGDHHKYTQPEVDALVNEARSHGAEVLITTAKDAIKLSRFRWEIPIYALEIQISIEEENRFIEIIKEAADQNRKQ